MEDNKNEFEVEFTDSERLKLQQLQLRRELANESKKKVKPRKDEHSFPNVKMLGENDPWRLIPANIKLHDWQKQCLDIWLPKGRGTVKVATGGGKTLFALAAAQKLQNVKVSNLIMTVVVPTIPLMNQWHEELSDSNMHPSQIGLLGGGNKINVSDDQTQNLKVILAVINSAREKLPEIINELNWSDRLLLVVDECHIANAKKAKKIFDTNPVYTLGLSATPEVNHVDETEQKEENQLDDDTDEDSIDQLKLLNDNEYAQTPVGKALGEIIFDFSLKDCLEAGLLTKFRVFHVGLSLTNEENVKYSKISMEISELRKDLQVAYQKGKNKLEFFAWCQKLAEKDGEGNAARFVGLTTERKRLLYSAENRMALTLLILKAATAESKIQKHDSKVIVFHESISSVNKIYSIAESENLPVVLEHSELTQKTRTESIELFRKGITKIIVSAKSLVLGFNVPSADIGIIAASSGSVRQRIQSYGRMLRKSSSSNGAVIFVLYIKDTSDETIYEKADWESVIGSERNRYFSWTNSESSNLSPKSLVEVIDQLEVESKPPRMYRPSCREIDTCNFRIGDIYPGQTSGIKVRADNLFNLKTGDDLLVRTSPDAVKKILQINKFKSANITPCGHLICRDSSKKSTEVDCWQFLENVEIPVESDFTFKEIYKIKPTVKKVIAKKVGKNELYALPSETLDCILQWLSELEKELSINPDKLYWNDKTGYWIEYEGKPIICEQVKGELEFKD